MVLGGLVFPTSISHHSSEAILVLLYTSPAMRLCGESARAGQFSSRKLSHSTGMNALAQKFLAVERRPTISGEPVTVGGEIAPENSLQLL